MFRYIAEQPFIDELFGQFAQGIDLVYIDIQILWIIFGKIKSVTAFIGRDDKLDFIKLVKVLDFLEKGFEVALIDIQSPEQRGIDIFTINELELKFLNRPAEIVAAVIGLLCILLCAFKEKSGCRNIVRLCV
jgi:hypothetical protein